MDKMKTDGLIPLAFGDFDGWPAMGTFDILNMRMNGYQFHVDLMAGKEKWTDPKVKAVFEAWQKLLPYYSDGGVGLKWQDATDPARARARPGCTSWARSQARRSRAPMPRVDLAFFPFPTLGTAFDAELGIDAPIDGLLLSKAPKNLAGAKALMQCFSTGAAQNVYLAANPSNVAAAKDADTSGYTAVPEGRWRGHRLGPVPSPSSLTATPSRRSPAPNGHAAAAAELHRQSRPRTSTAYLQGIQDLWDRSPSEQLTVGPCLSVAEPVTRHP